jgi:hypothetical protein
MRDSKGDGIRIHGRNAKVLLHEFERHMTMEEQDCEFLFTLAHEMVPFDPAWSLELLQFVSGRLPGMEPEVFFQLGRANEELLNPEGAIAHYTKAIEASIGVWPHADPLLRRGFLLKNLCPGDASRWTSDFQEAKKQARLMGMCATDLRLLRRASEALAAEGIE